MEQTVHLRVTDARSGRTLPCRLHIRDAYGQTRVPLGYLDDPKTEPAQEVGGHLVQEGKVWVYTDGSCEVRLPPGQVWVEAWHGPLYAPMSLNMDRGLGKIALRVQLPRLLDPAPGWYWCDTRAHFLPAAAAALEGAAEGLDLVHVLAARWDEPHLPRLAQVLEFSGQSVLLERYGCAVCVNTYQRGGPWGDLALLYCHRLVFPLTAGEPGFEHYTLADWCNQCHRKGGLVIWTAFPGVMGERLPLALLGQIDALEWCAIAPWNRDALQLWYALLNAGYSIPLVGASGKTSNMVALGTVRTATWLGADKPLTLADWVRAVQHGHTYVTAGPILHWQVNDVAQVWQLIPRSAQSTPEASDVGPTRQADENSTAGSEARSDYRLVARAESVLPFTQLELISGGEVIATATVAPVPSRTRVGSDKPSSLYGSQTPAKNTAASDHSREATVGSPASVQILSVPLYQAELSFTCGADHLSELPSGWLALRCWNGDRLVAHTSALKLPRRPTLRDQDRRYLEDALAQAETTIRTTPHVRQRELLQRLEEARRTLQTRLEVHSRDGS
ncbi:MAG: hypothetical protein NZM42_14165 [Gemmatales bacterium]|nr:hypothetical protein [Gemmatales bacterium]